MGQSLPPNIVQAFEQYGALTRDWAGIVAGYFHALRKQDFTRDEALQLTVAWQAITLPQLLTPKKQA